MGGRNGKLRSGVDGKGRGALKCSFRFPLRVQLNLDFRMRDGLRRRMTLWNVAESHVTFLAEQASWFGIHASKSERSSDVCPKPMEGDY
jgi:hypothetical protein